MPFGLRSLSDFLDLKRGTREDSELFERLVSILVERFAREWLANLKLGVRVVEAEVFLRQGTHISV